MLFYISQKSFVCTIKFIDLVHYSRLPRYLGYPFTQNPLFTALLKTLTFEDNSNSEWHLQNQRLHCTQLQGQD